MRNDELSWYKMLMVLWGMILCFQLWIAILTPTYFGGCFIGFIIGGLFIMGLQLMDISSRIDYENTMEAIINENYKRIDKQRNIIIELMMEEKDAEKPKRKPKHKATRRR